MTPAQQQIPVGVAVERRAAKSPWLDQLWRPVTVFAGNASAQPWTVIDTSDEVTTFYAGPATIELFRTETDNYLSNLQSGAPLLWVVLRHTAGDPGMALLAVLADPAEGEAMTGAGNDLVETVPMSAAISEQVRAFVEAHHIERPHFKRRRDRTNASPQSRDREEGQE